MGSTAGGGGPQNLKIHPDTLARRARAGEIPGCKVGRAWVFLPDLLREYVCARIAAPPALSLCGKSINGKSYRMLAQRFEGSRSGARGCWPTRRMVEA